MNELEYQSKSKDPKRIVMLPWLCIIFALLDIPLFFYLVSLKDSVKLYSDEFEFFFYAFPLVAIVLGIAAICFAVWEKRSPSAVPLSIMGIVMALFMLFLTTIAFTRHGLISPKLPPPTPAVPALVKIGFVVL